MYVCECVSAEMLMIKHLLIRFQYKPFASECVYVCSIVDFVNGKIELDLCLNVQAI